MNIRKMPWSFYAVLGSFAIFFGCLNIAILTFWLNHPFQSQLWIVGTLIGFILLLISIQMVRIHQRELLEIRKKTESEEQ